MFSLSYMQQYLPFWPSWIPSISIPSVLFTASGMLVGTLLNEVLAISKTIIPRQLYDKISSNLNSLIENYFSQMTLFIDEPIKQLSTNQMFEASETYLRSKINRSIRRLNISKEPGEEDICVSIKEGEKIKDTFQGIQLTWQVMNRSPERYPPTHRSIELRFNQKYKEKVLRHYLPHVLERSKAMKAENKVLKLYSYGGENWSSVNLDHPSTFDTLAMDPALKKELMDDLDRFVKRRDFYRTIGKAWKRGYLLYGPPGTGKSSLIAAMANHLKFHIYDLELTRVQCNSDFRNLLVSTANQSILVIEDIDCSKKIHNRQNEEYDNVCMPPMFGMQIKQVTLSGLLNFVDGLWSSCGDERIIIITANHIDKLDPALLRPGRMDMHIQMSYCTPCGFKFLASKYLGIKDHSMFTEIEKLVTEVEVTTAEIAEELMRSDKADKALGGLIKFLCTKKTEHDKANAEGKKEVNEQAKESPGNKEGAEKESGEK
ncbi:hypothetical protein ACSBR2_006774 [Camellia fascicularis]